jgi:SAM-dependent methyltransferase
LKNTSQKLKKRIAIPEPDEFDKVQLDQAKFFKELGLQKIFEKLDTYFRESCEHDTMDDFEKCRVFQKIHSMRGAEIFYLPDCRWYREVFSHVPANSIVLDAGAGDLRFSLALATKAKRVYAVEINPKVIGEALQIISYDLPKNVIPICRDVFDMPLPRDVNTVVCIMIHRQHAFPKSWNNRRVQIIHAEHDGVHNKHKVGTCLYDKIELRNCIREHLVGKIRERAGHPAHLKVRSVLHQIITTEIKDNIIGNMRGM